MTHSALPIAVLFSGRGSNLRALAEAIRQNHLNTRICCAVTDQPSAGGLLHAIEHALPCHIIDQREFPAKASFEQTLRQTIDASGAELIVLAGFMRVLTAEFVQHYRSRLINLHPSLLPKYRGLHTHARVLAAGDAEHGASVHLVESELDSGPVIAQYHMPVHAADTAATIAARLAPHEHRLLLAVTALFADRAIQVSSDHHMTLNGQPLNQPLRLDENLHWPHSSTV